MPRAGARAVSPLPGARAGRGERWARVFGAARGDSVWRHAASGHSGPRLPLARSFFRPGDNSARRFGGRDVRGVELDSVRVVRFELRDVVVHVRDGSGSINFMRRRGSLAARPIIRGLAADSTGTKRLSRSARLDHSLEVGCLAGVISQQDDGEDVRSSRGRGWSTHRARPRGPCRRARRSPPAGD